MSKHTTIKVSKKTLEKLHRLAGALAKENGRRVTLEGAIIQLLEEKERNINNYSQDSLLLEEDRKSFLVLLKKKVHGAGPEDFKEYNYEDIGGM